ncbi:Splicing factor 3B subunit 4 [Zancudomyces culisetae]|uniref:Splicing factor 3B subunit 4 n=1 Tax=Zancudomyces culisetae TaxID=1213189 RepID=A0A1R1PHX3_ZANCU|nr:Splicing factor 3B subunit 4 [Zancudomyces culisetae]|eukprot:OMH80580.1 Splicing factor 3B subunit 4 [Zancudomyces culisetae]
MSLQTERNQDATVYVGNLDERVTVELLWELMVQAGPVVNVHLPKDRVTQQTQGYGFCEFRSEADASYAVKIMNMIKLYGKPIRVNKALADKKPTDVGANVFISNLDYSVDEKQLYDTFSSFGNIISMPKIVRDLETGNSKGYGFISFDNFESSDMAIESMDGQYLNNKKIVVNYALKKDGKGERHGSAAERLLAAESKKNNFDNSVYSEGMAVGGGNPLHQHAPIHPVQMQPLPIMQSYGGAGPGVGVPIPGQQMYYSYGHQYPHNPGYQH